MIVRDIRDMCIFYPRWLPFFKMVVIFKMAAMYAWKSPFLAYLDLDLDLDFGTYRSLHLYDVGLYVLYFYHAC